MEDYEPVVWGVYWTLSILVTIFFVVADGDIEDQIFWIVTSAIHLGITIKFRYNTAVVYWMAALSIVVLTVPVVIRRKKEILNLKEAHLYDFISRIFLVHKFLRFLEFL